MQLLSQLQTAHEYDDSGRPTGRASTIIGGAQVYAECFTADGLGLRRTAWRHEPDERGTAYRYDGLSRVDTVRDGLAAAAVPASAAGLDQADMDAAAAAAFATLATSVTTMTYASGGTPQFRDDRDGAGGPIASWTYTANALHQVTSVNGVAVSYDDAGNVHSLGGRVFIYDAFRRLVAVDDGGARVGAIATTGWAASTSAMLGARPSASATSPTKLFRSRAAGWQASSGCRALCWTTRCWLPRRPGQACSR